MQLGVSSWVGMTEFSLDPGAPDLSDFTSGHPNL